MQKLVNREMMQEIDRITIQEIGIPAMVLMERAALKVYEHTVQVLKKQNQKGSVLAVCGIGNNGGDGIAAARMLHQAGFLVKIFVIGDMKKATVQMQEQVAIAKTLGVPFVMEPSYNDYSIILDAVFGIGLSRPIQGRYEQIIREMNESRAYVISVDLPSGVNADDGSILHVSVCADETVTFGYQKIGLVRWPGCEKAGKVAVEEVGFPALAYEKMMENHSEWKKYELMNRQDMRQLPRRPQHSNKGTFGKILVVAGSKGMSGACYFSAKAALRGGAGLVKVLTVEDNRSIIQTSLPEAVVLTYSEETLNQEELLTQYVKEIEQADVIIVGPGLGRSSTSQQILNLVLKHSSVWTIIDADGINLLADLVTRMCEPADIIKDNPKDCIQTRLNCLSNLLPEKAILTPHMKEFSRLIRCDISKIYNNYIDTLHLCSYNKVLIYIIKDSVTSIIHGDRICFSNSGNDGLATGGTGDVLTGVIGGLLAQGMDPYEAACLGVYVHGLTSEYYSKHNFSGSMLASDVIESLKVVLTMGNEME